MDSTIHSLSITYDEKNWKIQKTKEEISSFLKKLSKIQKDFTLKSKTKQIFSTNQNQLDENLLNDLIKYLISIPIYSNSIEFKEFIEYSYHSANQIDKKKEGYVYKRTGGRHGNENKCLYVCKYCRRLQKRWLILTDSFLGYSTTSQSPKLHEVLMFKDNFKAIGNEIETGYPDGIIIKTLHRNFFFHAGSIQKKIEWIQAINQALESSSWNTSKNLYGSSFPFRTGNETKWYVDGIEYYKDIYHSLINAKKEVFITDWWLSPEMFLLRPSEDPQNKQSQLVLVLREIAARGVEIYIHMYKEVTFALGFDSLHSKEVLKKNIPKNIQIIRHPQRSLMGGALLWSHHEKIVCIDQEVCYLGGLDLCFGRWDTQEHKLQDDVEPYIWNGLDYSNVRVKDFIDIRDHTKTKIDRNSVPRMPWHDIGMRAEGPVAADIAIHFIDLWNHVMTDITGHYYKNKNLIRSSNPDSTKPNFANTLSEAIVHSLNSEPNLTDRPIEEYKDNCEENTQDPEYKVHQAFPGLGLLLKNPPNTILNNPTTVDKPSIELNVPEMGLIHPEIVSDISSQISKINSHQLMIEGAKRLINLIQKPQKAQALQEYLELDLKYFENFIPNKAELQKRENEDMKEEELLKKKMAKNDGEAQLGFFLQPVMHIMGKKSNKNTCNCQVIRSASTWSYGLETPEASIHEAYLTLIKESKHFIYIENQFFISSTGGPPVMNMIGQQLVERIIEAHCMHQRFYVIIAMPLLPGFEGNVYDPTAAILKIQLYWEYQTIWKADNSIFKQLARAGIEPSDYISFYGLRTHAYLKDGPVTEIVYIHSKLMIVDDDVVIIGSANINDRSQLGINDSEIAMVITDESKVSSFMNGNPWSCSQFASSLRRSIFNEFLGDPSIDVTDPLAPKFIQAWKNTARSNTEIYREIFGCYPDDRYELLEQVKDNDLKMAKKESRDEMIIKYNQLIHNIKGFLVEFPTKFLRNELLTLNYFSKENLLPMKNYI